MKSLIGKTNILFGDSIGNGIAATLANQAWFIQLCARLGSTPDNRSQTGRSWQAGLQCPVFDPATIPTYDPATHGALFISLATNDINFGGTVSAFSAAMSAGIQVALSKGWAAADIVIGSAYYINGFGNQHFDKILVKQYRDAGRLRASQYGCFFLDFYTPFSLLPDRNERIPDGTHPDTLGHYHLADIAYDAIMHPPLLVA